MRGALCLATAWLTLADLGAAGWNPLSWWTERRTPKLSAWIVDWSDSAMREAMHSLQAADGVVDEVDLFHFRLSPTGELVDAGPHNTLYKRMLERASKRGAQRIVTLVNDIVGEDGTTIDAKNAAVPHEVFADPARSIVLVEAIVARIAAQGYDGLDLDFEELQASDRNAFSRFARHCARRLHDRGKRLIVTVQPQAKPETRDGPGAHDLEALAAAADEVRMMAYHEHYATSPPGAAASLPWVESLVDYALRFVPRDKLVLAIYVGGWRWTRGRGEQLSFAEAAGAVRELGVPVERSHEAGVPHAQAGAAQGPVEIWYEDGCSLERKAELARRRGIRGVALWRLGQEDVSLYALLKRSGDAAGCAGASSGALGGSSPV